MEINFYRQINILFLETSAIYVFYLIKINNTYEFYYKF